MEDLATKQTGQKTTIGKSITITGDLRSEEDISIEGNIRGQIKTTADLFVEENGTIEAEVSTRNLDVHGAVMGNVTASDRFEIHEGGNVVGNVLAPRVVVADGGKYKGKIDMEDNTRQLGQ